MPVIIVHDSLDFLQQLGAWHRRQFDVPVIGITGSNGKPLLPGNDRHSFGAAIHGFREVPAIKQSHRITANVVATG